MYKNAYDSLTDAVGWREDGIGIYIHTISSTRSCENKKPIGTEGQFVVTLIGNNYFENIISSIVTMLRSGSIRDKKDNH
jgi:hypothetical protein